MGRSVQCSSDSKRGFFKWIGEFWRRPQAFENTQPESVSSRPSLR